MINEGSEFLKNTSTKYTLMGKAAEDGDVGGSKKLAKDR